MRVAYRMLGSVADAEDVLQEAFIRWMKADRSEVRVPEAFLCRPGAHPCSRGETALQVEKQRGLELAEAFFHASRSGDMQALGAMLEADGELQTTALEIDDGKVVAIYVVRNPDKLRHLH
jgi:hypothetical protein